MKAHGKTRKKQLEENKVSEIQNNAGCVVANSSLAMGVEVKWAQRAKYQEEQHFSKTWYHKASYNTGHATHYLKRSQVYAP